MEARVADALSRAKAAGKLADGVEPSSAARILVCFVEGLRVVGKTAPTRITSQATADALLDRYIRAFSSEVDTGSRQENASKQIRLG
jgi:TetR/AcrR family transcriptional regulator, transcriptional repressor for nem operon